MQKEWTQISCEVPNAMVDAVSEFLINLSSNGVGIENRTLDTFSIESLEESPTKTVTAYFQSGESIEQKMREIEKFLSENGPNFSGFVYRAPTISRITEEDWSTSWKEHFKPLRVGEKLVIKPTWEEFSGGPTDILLEIDPGMAFGTGTHPTTMLCLAVLEKILAVCQPRIGLMTALDVGTGSGILSIAAAKLGMGRITAVDIDPEAIRVARENCMLNGIDERVAVSDTPLDKIPEEFDVILANILAEDLVRMAPDLVSRLKPDGFLILSGILVEKEGLVIDGFANYSITLTEVARKDDWSCLVLRRKN